MSAKEAKLRNESLSLLFIWLEVVRGGKKSPEPAEYPTAPEALLCMKQFPTFICG